MQLFVVDLLNGNNGYSLLGLTQALMALNRTADSAQIRAVYEANWAHADSPLETPCPAFSKQIITLDTGFKARRLRL